MEAKDADKTVIARPVASRPSSSSSNFRSFSELLAGAINESPSIATTEATIPIRPKTVRFMPPLKHSPVEVVPSLDFTSASADSSKSPVIHKPIAKLVSRNAASFLANMGNYSNIGHQQTSAQLQTQTDQATSNIHEDLRRQFDASQLIDPSKFLKPRSLLEQDLRAQKPTNNRDRVSYDGYNWRKSGQKQVKGSEYPRSYYKCTHLNCPVKKKVERRIAEIVYKGEHNHPKPQAPSKRLPSPAQGKPSVSDGSGRDDDDDDLLWSSNALVEKNDGSDGRSMENPHEVGFSVTANYPGKLLIPRVPVADTSCRFSGDCDEGSRAADGGHEPKRRKNEDKASRVGATAERVQESHVVVQANVESDVLGDGFRWRKYGQKVVKGNPYPRSYYRCTNPECNVRKHVERASDDPESVITTYEGKHNHEMPVN